jgi:hypothetical protein
MEIIIVMPFLPLYNHRRGSLYNAKEGFQKWNEFFLVNKEKSCLVR